MSKKKKDELFISLRELLAIDVNVAIDFAMNIGINNTIYYYPPGYPFDVEIQITAKEKEE